MSRSTQLGESYLEDVSIVQLRPALAGGAPLALALALAFALAFALTLPTALASFTLAASHCFTADSVVTGFAAH